MPMTTDGLIGGGLTVGGSVRPAQCRQVLQREGGGGARLPIQRDAIVGSACGQHRCRATQTSVPGLNPYGYARARVRVDMRVGPSGDGGGLPGAPSG